MKELIKKAIVILVLMMMLVNSSLLLIISEAIEEIVEQSEIEPKYEINLEKYVNYSTESSVGTLIQINAKTGIEYSPINSTEILLNMPKIEGEYPENVEIIEKNEKNFQHTYDNQTGELKIISTNLNNLADTEESKVETKQENEYAIILNYSANCYNNENIERELEFSGFVQAILDDEEKTIKKTDFKQNYTVSENISGLVSTKIKTTDIYNGYIQSNIENETEYKTDYSENLLIDVSKRDVANEIIINAKNELINSNDEKFETNEIVYKSTKIEQSELLSKLGEEGYIQILDEQGQIIGEINKDNCEVTYENEISKITIKTSKPLNVGTILLQNAKQIKETMKDIQNSRINVNNVIHCIIDEKETYQFENNNETEIKNAETKVGLAIDKMVWTNNIQNDVNITATLMANNIKYKLFKNPILEIKLPEEVEKVILGEVSLLYDNGLNIKNKEIVEQDNYKVIRIELEGKQNEYFTNSIMEGTSISIPATIIVKKDAQTADKNINLTYTNEGEETKNEELKINIESNVVEQPEIDQVDEIETSTQTEENNNTQEEQQVEQETVQSEGQDQASEEKPIEGLDVKVEAILGDSVLEDGATIHEKQIIKYKVTATNNSTEKIENIKVECDVPEGTTYATVDIGTFLQENYEYKKDVNVKKHTMVIKEIESGKSKSGFYEVIVDELADSETQKNITNTFTTKVNDKTYSTQTINNVIEKAELEVYIRSYFERIERNSFVYYLDITNLTDHDISNVQLETNQLQKEFVFKGAEFYDEYGLEAVGNINENNQYVATIDTIKAGKTRTIHIEMLARNFDKNVNECPIAMVMKVNADGIPSYISNENRRTAYPEYVTVSQTLDKEGENVLAGDIVEFKYAIKNESKVKTAVDIKEQFSKYLEDVVVKFNLYDIVNPDEAYNGAYETHYDLEAEQNIEYSLRPQEIPVSELEEYNKFSTQTIIPAGKTLEITVTAKAKQVVSLTEVVNYMVVSGEQIETQSSNLSKFYILGTPDPDEDPEYPDDPENKGDPEDPDNPDNPAKTDNYNINGKVWIDKNKDGEKQSDEKTLGDVFVKLYNASTNSIVVNENNEKQIVKTNSTGAYSFTKVPTGNYLVLFEYDTQKYDITKFTKYGEDRNTSNAMKKTVNIDGQEKTVGLTDIIKVEDESLSDVNIGLIEKGNFDLKLDKYITQITVKNNTTTTYEYNNSKLAKIEIPAKQIDKTQVEIKYKIVITNEGNITAYADEIVDYIPKEMQLNKENTKWSINRKGELINNSLIGNEIRAGESKELELIVTKKMNAQNTGTIINAAEIASSKNAEGLNDVDSIEGNKNNKEDDYSEATVIISISTGLVRNIIICIIAVGLIGLIIVFIRKVKNKKTFTFIIALVMFTVIFNVNSYARVEINGTGSPFTGSDGRVYTCLQAGKAQCFNGGRSHHYYEYRDSFTDRDGKVYMSGRTAIATSYDTKPSIDIKMKEVKPESSENKKTVYRGCSFTTTGDFTHYNVAVSYIPKGKEEKDRTTENVKIENKKKVENGGTFDVILPLVSTAKDSVQITVEATIADAIITTTTYRVIEYYQCVEVTGPHGSRQGCSTATVQWMKHEEEQTTTTTEDRIVRKTMGATGTKLGSIRVIKKDTEGNLIKMDDSGDTTEFKVYQEINGKVTHYLKFDGDSTKVKYVNEEDAGIFKIQNTGTVTLDDVNVGDGIEYFLIETKAKKGYEKKGNKPLELVVSNADIEANTIARRGINCIFTRYNMRHALRKLADKEYDNEINTNDDVEMFISIIYRLIIKGQYKYEIMQDDERPILNEIKRYMKQELNVDHNDKIFASGYPTYNEMRILVNYISRNWLPKSRADILIKPEKDKEFMEKMIEDMAADLHDFGYYDTKEEAKEAIQFTPISNARIRAFFDNVTPNEIENVKSRGWLKIVKQDKYSNKRLNGATFRIYGTSEEGKKISISKTTTTIEGEKGVILTQIDYGTYNVEEIESPKGYKLENQVEREITGTVKVTEKNTKKNPAKAKPLDENSTVFKNRNTGWLKIEKQDQDTGEMLAGATFRIYGTVKVGENEYEESEKVEKVDITKTTDENGEILVELKFGTYTIEETKAPEGYILENQPDYDPKTGKVEKKGIEITNNRTKSNPLVITMENEKGIKIEGRVWEDIEWTSGKETQTNGLYKNTKVDTLDTQDKDVSNVTVQLKDKNGTVVDTKITNAEGKYTFERVDIDKLPEYYIEFQYNGMGYENVQVNTTKNNGSKASEGSNRTEFNNNYETISYGTSNKYTLDYDTRYKGESKLIYNSKEKKLLNYGYSGNESSRDPITGVDSQYVIKANTKNACGGGYLSSLPISETNTNKATPENIIKNKISKIENINLGIKKRDKIDLSISKELYQVAMNLNNQTNYYNYTDRNVPTNRCTLAPQVKFGEETGRHPYSRGVYASDIAYNGKYWGLSVYVTYKIRIENTSPRVVTYVNELVDYYDSKYTRITRVGLGEDSKGNGIKYTNEQFDVIENTFTDNSEYKKATIRPREELLKAGGGVAAEIFVELQVDNSKLLELLDKENNSDEIVKLDNLVEINSYSSKKDGQTYAAIDIDSQPGNLDISSSKTSTNSPYVGDISTYEDDTDLAPGLKIVLQEDRKIKGMVFKDTPTSTIANYDPNGIYPNEIREGDGKYTEASQDQKLKGIKVRLVLGEVNGDPDTMGNVGDTAKKFIYDYKTKTYSSVPIETETDENGEYELSGCLPGVYYVEYTWGNNTYRVQDYKNTIVDKNEYIQKTEDIIDGKHNARKLLWYAKEELDVNARKSDALDDYETRKKIDEQTKYMTYGSKYSINDVYQGHSNQIKTGETTWETAITQMKSKTPNFQMCFEYCKLNGGEIATSDEYETVENNGETTLKIENGEYGEKYLVKKEGYKNIIKNIDFGIIERAKQVLELKKEVSSVKIILQNGMELINVQIDENGNLKEKVKNVTFTPKSTVNGQLKAEMDNAIIQGATLKVEYTIKVKNNSEADFLNSNYYWFGISTRDDSNPVLLTPVKIVDYIDNTMVIDIPADDILDTNKVISLRNKGYFSNENDMCNFHSTVKNAYIIKNFENTQLLRGQETEDVKLKESRILSTELIRNGVELENHAEIIQINQTGGRPIKTTPGNYIPSDSSTSEEDDDRAEEVTIVPATGLSVDYIAYTLLAISSLGILTAGIILIKKYIA